MSDYDPKIFTELDPEIMESTVLADTGVSTLPPRRALSSSLPFPPSPRAES